MWIVWYHATVYRCARRAYADDVINQSRGRRDLLLDGLDVAFNCCVEHLETQVGRSCRCPFVAIGSGSGFFSSFPCSS